MLLAERLCTSSPSGRMAPARDRTAGESLVQDRALPAGAEEKGPFMIDHRHARFAAALLAGTLLALPSTAASKPTIVRGSPTPTVTVYATGLNNPRGLHFGPDGMLYVAEGGVGGADSTVGQCTQVVPPLGPYTGSPTGSRISRIENGVPVTVNDKFASSQTARGSLVSGVSDIEWIDGQLYAL